MKSSLLWALIVALGVAGMVPLFSGSYFDAVRNVSAEERLEAVVDEGEVVRQVVIRGSDGLAKILRLWAERYNDGHPDVQVVVDSIGSGSGIASLLNSHAEVAASGRPLRYKEIRVLERRGLPTPVNHVVAYDGIALVVHPTNPLNGISLPQLGAMYDREGNIRNWKDLRVTVPGCEDQQVQLVSRKNTSGTYAMFRMAIFYGARGHFSSNMKWRSHNEEVLAEVAANPCAIGYVGSAYLRDAAVKPLCVSAAAGTTCVLPNAEAIRQKVYPLTRPLYLITLGPPAPPVQRFLDWITGQEAQAMLPAEGYVASNP